MSGADLRDTSCSVKWCDETGPHAVHRKYLASMTGGLRGSGLIGVNLAQHARPRLGVCVELTVTTTWAGTFTTMVRPSSATEIGKAIISAAARADAADRTRRHSPPSPS